MVAGAMRALRAKARQDRLAQSAVGRPALRTDRPRHAGGAAIHRSARARAQPRIARAAPAGAGRLMPLKAQIHGDRDLEVLRRQGFARGGVELPHRSGSRRTVPAGRRDHEPGRRADACRHHHGEGRAGGGDATRARCGSSGSTPQARTAEIVAAGQDVRGKGGADMRMTSRSSNAHPAKPR